MPRSSRKESATVTVMLSNGARRNRERIWSRKGSSVSFSGTSDCHLVRTAPPACDELGTDIPHFMPPLSPATSPAMRSHYLSLGLVETQRGTWHSPAGAIARKQQHKSRRKARVVSVDSLTWEMSSTRLHGGERPTAPGTTLGSLRQPCSSHAIAAALASCSMGTGLAQSPMEAADQMMLGLVPSDWRDYMADRHSMLSSGDTLHG